MNLLNSKEFVENYVKSKEEGDNNPNELNDFIKRSMKFYSKNFYFIYLLIFLNR